MTDEQLIEKIAEILFKEEKIDCLGIYDNLEALFFEERPEVRLNYLEEYKKEELRTKEQEVMKLRIQLTKAQRELEEIKGQ